MWEQIEAQYGADMRTFANDWQNASMPEAWKVASGMYLPIWHSDDADYYAEKRQLVGQRCLRQAA